jgi:biopolymer transport protein ExbB/TolQ
MKQKQPSEFLYSILSLLAIVVVIHTFFVTTVWPNADRVRAEQAAAMKADPNYVSPRSIWVIIKDYEQESEIILMLWALALMGYKARLAQRERQSLEHDLLQVPDGMRILPEDTREYLRQLEAQPPAAQELLVVRALRASLARFGATRDVQATSEAARTVCESEADRLDAELSLIRYIAWAIPAIGFIGTVRGIGDALGAAHKAVTGDISGVTEGLGVAFNSTLVALLLSLLLMFLLHNLQLAQERLAMDTDTYLDQKLLRHLQVR